MYLYLENCDFLAVFKAKVDFSELELEELCKKMPKDECNGLYVVLNRL